MAKDAGELAAIYWGKISFVECFFSNHLYISHSNIFASNLILSTQLLGYLLTVISNYIRLSEDLLNQSSITP